MSSRAVASPEDLEQFARELKQFNAQLTISMSQLQSRFNRLGDTWRDQEQQKFAREFEQTMRVLHHFVNAADEQAPFLIRKAQHLRAYLGQH